MSFLAHAIEERYETIIDALLEHPDIDVIGNMTGVKSTTIYQIMKLKSHQLADKVVNHPKFDIQKVSIGVSV
jgi:hypothetical protein